VPKPFYLLTAFGKDRPGIVADVTRSVFQGGGNVEDASMTRLGGEFVMMLVVGLPHLKAADRLERSLQSLQKKLQLTLTARMIPAKVAKVRHELQATHLISMYGADRPGIVYRAAQTLSARGLNITDLHTKTLQSARKPLYVMLLEARIPTKAKAAAIGRTLQRLGKSLKLSVTLQDIEAVSL
jgi:glycine cleavage system transcriptional repressor